MDRPEKGQDKKIVLPASGLAEDILGMLQVGKGPDEPEASPAEAPSWGAFDGGWDDAGPEKKEEESFHLVGFFLNDEEYALEISQVQEIIRVGSWTRVPNAPVHVLGVINLRGRIMPVIDPKARMDLKPSSTTKRSRIVVVETDGKVLGLLVDSVSQVLRLPSRVVEPPPDELSDSGKAYIKGVGKLDGRLVMLMDIYRILGKEIKEDALA